MGQAGIFGNAFRTTGAAAVCALAAALIAPALAMEVLSTETSLGGRQHDYRRIIAFSPAITEIVYRLGAQDRLAGVALYSDYPPEAKDKPTVGGILNIDSEKVLSLSPDLILSPPGAVAGEKLPSFGADVIFIPDDSLSDVEQSFKRIGEIVGKTEEGNTLARNLREAVESAQKRNAALPRVKALVVIGYEPLWVAGGAGAVNEILRAVGGENTSGGVKKNFYAPNFEQVLASGPEVIVDLTLDAPDTNRRREAVRAFWRRFRTIPAVANHRVEFVDSDLLTIPGPRLVESDAAIEKALRNGTGGKGDPDAAR